MSFRIPSFVFGIVIGGGVCVALFVGRSHRTTTTAMSVETVARENSPNKTAELETALASLKEQLTRTQLDKEALAARIQELEKGSSSPSVASPAQPAKVNPFAAMFGGEGTNGMSEAMSSMMKSMNEQQVEAKLSGMKPKLKLSTGQEQAIRDLLARQMSVGVELAQKMFKGDVSKEEMADAGKNQPNYEEQIKALLSPEQQAGYDEFQKDEQTRMARLLANSELMQLQSQLQLSEEQQDKAFAILADRALEQTHGPSDPTAALDLRSRFTSQAEALKGILSAEQFERYQKFQEQQLKLIESFMPQLGGGEKGAAAPNIAK